MIELPNFDLVLEEIVASQKPPRPPLFAGLDNGQVPRRWDDPERGADHDARAVSRDDAGECQVARAQGARCALLEYVKAAACQSVLEVDRPAGFSRFDYEEARVTLTCLLDELAMKIGTGFDLLVQSYRSSASCWVSWCTRWCESPSNRVASRALIFSLPVRKTRTARRAARAARRSSSSAFLRSVA